jgi:hypothetical protein
MGSKPLHVKLREKRNHPPPNAPWVWLSRDLLESDAWRTAPINTRRVVDRLMLEHMAHAGTMNGKLVCTYDDFEKWGVGQQGRVAQAIRDAVERGLVVVTEKGKASSGERRWPNKYALGWFPTHDGAAALNRWKDWKPGNAFSLRDKAPAANGANRTFPAGQSARRTAGQSARGKSQFSVNSPAGQSARTFNILGGTPDIPTGGAAPLAPPQASRKDQRNGSATRREAAETPLGEATILAGPRRAGKGEAPGLGLLPWTKPTISDEALAPGLPPFLDRRAQP